jgi:hypothetical protein
MRSQRANYIKQKRKPTAAQLARAAELIEREIAFEAMMDERIKELCPIIREENNERKRDNQDYHTEPRAMRVVIGRPPKPTVLDWD